MIDADVVALINKQGDHLAIWHVVIDPTWPMNRLCGAWVDTVAPALYAQRYLLPFDDQLPADLSDIAGASAGNLDANATREGMITKIVELDALHQDSPTKAGKPRTPITWPRVPAPLDWSNLPAPPNGVADDLLTSTTIAVATWVSRLADVWAEVEVQRLSRDYLADSDVSAQPMPVVLRS